MNDPGTTRREFLSGRTAGDEAGVLADVSAPPTTPVTSRVLTTLSKQAMACWFEFLVDAKQFPKGPELCQEALELVEEIEQELTVYRPASHLCEVNRKAADEAVSISPRLLEILSVAIALHRETGGAFDVTAGPLSKTWGFYHRDPKVPPAKAVDEALSRVGSQFIELNPDQATIRFRKPGLEINLASIGKGYALDRGADYLREHGVTEFVLHGGQSSVLAAGGQNPARPDQGWPIGLVHPVNPQARMGLVWLRDRALGTSGCQRQWLIHEGKRLGHILDPRTGWPTTQVLSATVLAPSAALADALSTAFSVMALAEVESYCRAHPEISAIIARENAHQPQQPELHWFNLESGREATFDHP